MRRSFYFVAVCCLGANVWAGGHQHSGGAGTQSLDVYNDGDTMHLLVGESRSESAAPELIYLSSQDGETWSASVRVDAGLPAPHNVHRGMDPQIVASGDNVIAIWMTKGTGYADSGPLVSAVSQDGGKTWKQGPNPADDGTTTGHNFIDMASDRSGRIYLTWLDSRDGAQGLRFSSSADRGKSWGANVTLKSGSCECCWNAIAVGDRNEVAILFRDRDPRDMGLVWSGDSGTSWQKPRPVGSFGWKFDGCPHVGGGVAMDEFSGVHAIVWNGAADNRGVFYLASKDQGMSWRQPRRLGGEDASHPDLAVGKAGAIAAAWDVYTNEGTKIESAVSTDGGETWSEPIYLTEGKSSSAHPRVITCQDGFRVFWTESKSGSPSVWRSRLLRK